MTQDQDQKCIEACIECATICNHCAISCVEEGDVQHLTQCIRLDLECAVITRVSAELMSLGSRYAKEICRLCAIVCNDCAKECEKHTGMEHCKECADTCRACARETMKVFHDLENAGSDNRKHFIHQNECAVISRAAAELMSLRSAYCKQICELSATICNAYSGELDSIIKKEMQSARQCATIATEAQQQFKAQEMGTAKKAVKQRDVDKKRKKHSSALLAASMWHSPVQYSLSHLSGGLTGEYANMGTNVSYDEEDI